MLHGHISLLADDQINLLRRSLYLSALVCWTEAQTQVAFQALSGDSRFDIAYLRFAYL